MFLYGEELKRNHTDFYRIPKSQLGFFKFQIGITLAVLFGLGLAEKLGNVKQKLRNGRIPGREEKGIAQK